MQITAMGTQILLLLPFVASAAARASFVGDIRSLLHPSLEKRVTIVDIRNSPLYNAGIAMEILWACVLAILLIAILFNLRKLPTMSTRAPYILLATGTLLEIVSYGLYAGMDKNANGMWPEQYLSIASAGSLAHGISDVFLLTSIIWIIQQRSGLLTNSKGSTVRPVTSQGWKRGFDWILVFVLFGFAVGYYGFVTKVNLMLLNIDRSSIEDQAAKHLIVQKLYHVLAALFGILTLDIIVSLVLLRRSGKREQFGDKTVNRLLLIVAPFAALYFVSRVAFDIWYTNHVTTMANQMDTYAANVAGLAVNGFCQSFMIIGLILAMTAPAVGDYSGQYGTGSSKILVQYPQGGDESTKPHYVQKV